LSSNANLLESKGKILAQLNKREEAIKFFEAALLEYKSNGLSGDWLTPKINALKKGDILPKEESD
jgi:predicted negative regulator of RcsB-dependent stress response